MECTIVHCQVHCWDDDCAGCDQGTLLWCRYGRHEGAYCIDCLAARMEAINEPIDGFTVLRKIKP